MLKTLTHACLILAGTCTLLGCGNSLPANALPLSTLLENLEANGMEQIKEATFDEGYWEMEGVQDGKNVEVHVNATSGAIVLKRPELHMSLPEKDALKASDVAKMLEQAGYHKVYKLDWEQTHWDVIAIKDEERHLIKVDSNSNQILSDRVFNVQHIAPK